MTVVVVTECRFTGDLLCAYVESECGIPCRLASEANEEPAPRERRLLLIDCHGGDGYLVLEKVRRILQAEPGATPLAALFDLHGDEGLEREAVSMGVRGFLYSHDPAELLKKAVQALFDGELWIERRKVAQILLGEGADTFHRDSHVDLTERECGILDLLRGGSTNEEIAQQLNISRHTVKTHLYHIFKKIEAPNRLQAAIWASRHRAEIETGLSGLA